jgi:putative lumazine-binding protein
MKRATIFFVAVVLLSGGIQAAAAGESDREAVRRTALAYAEAFYEADPARIEKYVHPEVANRGFVLAAEGGFREVRMDFAGLKQNAASINKKGNVFPKSPIKEVVVYDVLDSIATVKVLAEWGVDYLHLAKYGGQWKVLHVLWQAYPEKP